MTHSSVFHRNVSEIVISDHTENCGIHSLSQHPYSPGPVGQQQKKGARDTPLGSTDAHVDEQNLNLFH